MKGLLRAGEICKDLKKEIVSRVAPGVSVLEFVEWLEGEIRSRGGEPAFPVNVSIDDQAAHFSPGPNYSGVFEEGQLIKVDFGVHIDGWATDNAITVDLGEHGELVSAAESALEAATELVVSQAGESTLSDIGSAIERAIKEHGFSPIVNLTGHSIKRWNLHGGISIYNYDTGSSKKIGEGVFAIEPFATTGAGRVKNGPNSEIFKLVSHRKQRLPALRDLLKEISRFNTLPFSSRWVSRPQYLPLLVRDGSIHNYPVLVEVSGGKVSQAENTFLIEEGKVKIVT